MKKQRINILQFLTALLLGLVSVSCQQDDWGEKIMHPIRMVLF